MKMRLVILFVLLSAATVRAADSFDLKQQVQDYESRYNLPDPFTKLVDNQGEGYSALYGVRNFRAVLKGVYYRGGANNAYNKYGRRANENPLPALGLTNLCKEGFTDTVYLYPTRFSSAAKQTSCVTNEGKNNSTLTYSQMTALDSGNEHPLLKLIYQHITGERPGPIYDHCWNGWHASGYVAALSLRQFCGWSAKDAVAYWIKNTDGNSAGHASLIARIQNFTAYGDLKIGAEQAALICPQN